jgi:SNF2 family DNA or RNA helicase
MNSIKKGTIIKGPQWSEPVIIDLIEEFGEYMHIVGSTRNSHAHVDDLILESEFSNITFETMESKFTDEPWKVFLALEAIRYRYASLYDPLLAMNISKVDPLPHQIEAVYGVVLKLPRIRFLIADDPGAGKTIMAGLIIKELKLRNIIRRVLIVTPGHLKDQWRRELSDRFEEKFIVVDRGHINAFYGENVWARENQIITSIDFAKRDEIIASISATCWDLIVVDEAHKMSAYRFGGNLEKTGRYKLGETLSRITEHLLFLTATPHKGDKENFKLFLDLLVPGFFANDEMLDESIQKKDNPLFIRRIKEDLKDFDGNPIFKERSVLTIPFRLGVESPVEKELYNDLYNYVKNQYNKALAKDNKRNITFALVILQRRFASSTYALFKSLMRRKEKLEGYLDKADECNIDSRRTATMFDFEEVDEMDEEERWKEEEIWETLSVAENRQELVNEIEALKQLIESAREIINDEEEIKLKKLKEALARIKTEIIEDKDRKILIFTEARDTLDYLEKKIKSWGFSITTIHGGMKIEDRIKAERVFKNESEVMIATEAAGEGINLQFCNLMINYDLPWNPNRLEQRMGRIHRYGQRRKVFVYNLVALDTREGQVFNRLLDKLAEIRKKLGNDKVFDVVSEVVPNKLFTQMLVDAITTSRNIDEIVQPISFEVNEKYVKELKENLGESLATRYIDYTRIKEMKQQAIENRLIPEYTERLFKKAFEKAGGKLKVREDGFLSIESVPQDLKKIAQEDSFKLAYGELLKRYPIITFDKDIAFAHPDVEFISFDHPLFESVLTWIERNFKNAIVNGAIFHDADGKLDGYILYYEGEVKDGKGKIAGKRLFAFYHSTSEIRSISPWIIWDLAEGNPPDISGVIDIEAVKKDVSIKIVSKLQEYKQEITIERERQADIKQRYGLESLKMFILELDGELIQLLERKERGENVDLAIFNKRERKRGYEHARDDLQEQIKAERTLTIGMPRFLGVIRVSPLPSATSPLSAATMKSDAEIEQIGMRKAIAYEISQGRAPQDVSAEKLGFDIRSLDASGLARYIEVKARAGRELVSLTENEWIKANRFKDDYYLYVVYNAITDPELRIVQDPINNLDSESIIEIKRYIIPVNEILAKGEKVNE